MHWDKRDQRRFQMEMVQKAILDYAGLSPKGESPCRKSAEEWIFRCPDHDPKANGISLQSVLQISGGSIQAVQRAARLTEEEGDVLGLKDMGAWQHPKGALPDPKNPSDLYFNKNGGE